MAWTRKEQVIAIASMLTVAAALNCNVTGLGNFPTVLGTSYGAYRVPKPSTSFQGIQMVTTRLNNGDLETTSYLVETGSTVCRDQIVTCTVRSDHCDYGNNMKTYMIYTKNKYLVSYTVGHQSGKSLAVYVKSFTGDGTEPLDADITNKLKERCGDNIITELKKEALRGSNKPDCP